MRKILKLPALDRLKQVLKYCPESGVFTWIEAPKVHPKLQGKIAGGTATGYVVIRIDNKKYRAHRLAWLYFYGEEPSGDIDHKNGNTFDNSIENLRIATNPQNQANRTRNHGRLLPKGVRKISSGMFNARIGFEKKQIYLGVFSNVHDAEMAYLSAAKKYYGEFARAS